MESSRTNRLHYMIVDKKKVYQRFAQAADTYEKQAIIQHKIAAHLLSRLTRSGCGSPQSILEIGSCTGLLTKKLLTFFPAIKYLYVNDLVADFESLVMEKIQAYQGELSFLPGDIETISLPSSCDLIISSSTFHWLHDVAATIEKLSLSLQAKGCLAFAMYGPENLYQIRELTGITLQYHSLAHIRKITSKYFVIKHCEESTETLRFKDPLQLLNHLRQTGVNSLDHSVWTRQQVHAFLKSYREKYGDDKGVSLSYHPMYFIAQKK